MLVTLEGTVISLSPLQYSKADSPILVTGLPLYSEGTIRNGILSEMSVTE